MTAREWELKNEGLTVTMVDGEGRTYFYELKIGDLESQCRRASKNTSKQCRDGVITVKYRGVRG